MWLRVLTGLVIAPLASAQDARTHPVSELEAIQLVERSVPGFVVDASEARFEDGRPVRVFVGQHERHPATAVVDASCGRVLRVQAGDEVLYRFEGVRAVVRLDASQDVIERGADVMTLPVRASMLGDAGTLRAALEALGGRCDVDLDFESGDPAQLVALLRELGLEKRVTLQTPDRAVGREVIRLEPQIRWRPTWRPERESILAWRRATGAEIVSLEWPHWSEAIVREAHLAGLQVFLDLSGRADTPYLRGKAFEVGADFVQSDAIDELVRFSEENGYRFGRFGARVDPDTAMEALELPSIDRLVLGAGVSLGRGPDKENSGLAKSPTQDGVFWMLNDSGDEPRVYAVRRDGSVVGDAEGVESTGTRIGGAINVDWEDLCFDASGHLIVADFGNNANSRRDLCLYYLQEPRAEAVRTTWFKRVWFRYPRQKSFPAERDDFDYDAEGVFCLGDRVFVWSKNRSDRASDLYVLDDTSEGRVHDLRFLGAFRFDGNVTGADASPDGSMVAVLTYTGVWIFDRFLSAERVLDGRVRHLPVRGIQLEAITFADPDTLLLGDEKRATLHEVPLSRLVVVREARE